MKIQVKLPGGGEITFEKSPMSKEALEILEIAVPILSLCVPVLIAILLLR